MSERPVVCVTRRLPHVVEEALHARFEILQDPSDTPLDADGLNRVFAEISFIPVPSFLSRNTAGEVSSNVGRHAFAAKNDHFINVSGCGADWSHIEPLAQDVEP